MESFQNIRKEYFKNPLMGYFNIKCLRNKIIDPRKIVKYLELDYFVLREKKKMMKTFYHNNLLLSTLRLALGKMGIVIRNCQTGFYL